MDNKQNVLDEYIKFRRLKNHTEAIESIILHTKLFMNHTKKPLKDFDDKVLLNYISEISPTYSIEMMNKIKSSIIKNFLKWYYPDWSSRFRNIDSVLRTEKGSPKYKPEDMLTEEDFKKLMAKESDRFWKAYFMTLFYGCCRPSEVCDLKWKDVEFEPGEEGAYINIYSAKNKKNFLKYIPKDVVFYLKELKEINSEWVFWNEKTKSPITRRGALYQIKTLSKKALGKPIDLYTLRHSIATINYNKDDIKDTDVATQMGHTTSMKNKYVHNNKAKLKEKARKIYISPEELPPEKKHQLEIDNENFKKEIDKLKKQVKTSTEQTERALLMGENFQKILDKLVKEGAIKKK